MAAVAPAPAIGVSFPPPSRLLARATDEALTQGGSLTLSSIVYAVAINLAALLLCCGVFAAARHSKTRWSGRLYAPRPLAAALAASEAGPAPASPAAALAYRQSRRYSRVAPPTRLPPLPSPGAFAFLLSLSDEEVLEHAGLDALAFIRFHEVCV